MNIENKTREDLIKAICEATGDNVKDYADWTVEELQELAINL